MRSFVTCATIGGLLATASAIPTKRENKVPESVNGFANITVSKELSWTPCFQNYTCANLEVPLDYADEKAGTTNIAFVKFQSGDGSGPDVLYNPGGPGASGVLPIISGGGAAYLKYFPDGNYNLIGFDPRGVNNSGPTLTCFPEDPTARKNYNTFKDANSNAPPAERYQRARANGERCSRANAKTNAKYAGTSAVVQDLKHFIELNAVAKGQKAEDAKFYYWGTSYGTVLGQTLAAMYPNQIERMVLDGNLYGEEWYQGDIRRSVDDSDDAVGSFFKYCVEAGPEKCMFAGGNATADDLELRYKNILQKLEDEPLVVSGLDQPIPSVVTRTDLTSFTFQMSYAPRRDFPKLAQVFSEIDVGNSSAYLQFKSELPGAASSLDAKDYYSKVPNPDYSFIEALEIITCIDVAGRSPFSREEYIKLLREYDERSYYAGNLMGSTNALACVGYDINPPESQYFPGFNTTQTKSPILFMNSLRDPVTPHISAVKSSKFFPGSSVLAIDITGHGFMAVKSACANDHFKAYWEKGELPKEGTICKGDLKPLVDPFPPPTA